MAAFYLSRKQFNNSSRNNTPRAPINSIQLLMYGSCPWYSMLKSWSCYFPEKVAYMYVLFKAHCHVKYILTAGLHHNCEVGQEMLFFLILHTLKVEWRLLSGCFYLQYHSIITSHLYPWTRVVPCRISRGNNNSTWRDVASRMAFTRDETYHAWNCQR